MMYESFLPLFRSLLVANASDSQQQPPAGIKTLDTCHYYYINKII